MEEILESFLKFWQRKKAKIVDKTEYKEGYYE